MTTTIQKILKPTKYRAEDTSGNNNHGQIYSGRGLEFDGVSDYFNISEILGISYFNDGSEWTWTSWMYWNDTGDTQFIGRDGTTHPYIGIQATGGDSYFEFRDENAKYYRLSQKLDHIISNTWTRWVIVSDGININFYINGILIGTIADGDADTTAGFTFSTTKMFLNGWGGPYASGGRNSTLDGKMSDGQVWDAAWTQSDVTFDYLNPESLALNNGGTSLTESNLKLWYPMQDGHRGQQSYILDGANTGLGPNLMTNGDMELDDASWSGSNLDDGDTSIPIGSLGDGENAFYSTAQSYNGSRSLYCNMNDQNDGVNNNTATLVSGVTYKISAWVYKVSGNYVEMIAGTSRFASTLYNKQETTLGVADANVWEEIVIYGTCDSDGAAVIQLRAGDGATEWYTDNVTVRAVNNKHHATTVFYGDEQITDDKNQIFDEGTSLATYGWVGYAAPGDTPATASITGDGKLQIATSLESPQETQGATLPVANLTAPVAGRTYRIKAYLDDVGTANADAIYKFSFGGTAETITASDGAPTGGVINTSNQEYYADVVAANTTGDLIILIPSGANDAVTTFTIDAVSVKEVGTATGWTDADQQLDIPQTALQSYNQLAWFDGQNSNYATLDSTINTLDNAWSLSFWLFNKDTGQSFDFIIGSTNNKNITVDNNTDRKLYYRDGDSDYNALSDAVIPQGEWVHIVITAIADTSMTAYINGEAQTTSTSMTASSVADTQLIVDRFMSGYNTSSYESLGSITEISYYANRAIGQATINELYNNGKALDARDSSGASYLTHYWRNNGLAEWKDLKGSNDANTNGVTETLLLPAGVDASRDNQGFLMNRQKDTNSFNLASNLLASGLDDGPHAKVKHIDLGTSDFSVCFWIYKVKDWTDQYIVSQVVDDNNRWYIRGNNSTSAVLNIYAKSTDIDSGNDYVILSDNDTVDLDTNQLDKWLHVVVTVDRSDTSAGIQWYLNGNASSNKGVNAGEVGVSVGQPEASLSLAADVTIGWNEQSGQDDHHFDGMIDDLLIYNDKLEATEVKRIYNSGKRSHR